MTNKYFLAPVTAPSASCPLDPGSNTIEVLAFNGYSEGRAITEVVYQTTQTAAASSLPNMYILSIGVNSYTDNSIPNLRFAANDAQRIVEAFRTQEGRCFASFRSLVIADGTNTPPTRSNIADGLDFLRGAGANDVMVLGLFTYVLIQGLSGTADADKPPRRHTVNPLEGNLFRIFITQRRRGRRNAKMDVAIRKQSGFPTLKNKNDEIKRDFVI